MLGALLLILLGCACMGVVRVLCVLLLPSQLTCSPPRRALPTYLQAAAEGAMLRMLSVPEHSRAETKRLLHSGFAREWQGAAEAEAAAMWERFSSPEVVGHLGAVLQRLSKSKKWRSRL